MPIRGNVKNPILIAGGYGVIGTQITKIMCRRHPEIPLILAGRNPAEARALVDQYEQVEAVYLDICQPRPLKELGESLQAVVAVVNDPSDYLLLDAIQAGIPILDITRWTERFRRAISLVEAENPRAPVMLSSSWMAGLVPFVGMTAAEEFESIDSIDIGILFSLKDKSGPDSVEYMDRFSVPYQNQKNGQSRLVHPLSDSRIVQFGEKRFRTYNFDSPEQLTLPLITGAQSVISRISFDSSLATKVLVAIVRTGIWKLISGERFARLRHAILHNPGEGGEHRIRIEVAGKGPDQAPKKVIADIVDREGQTHLTAVGAIIQLERLLAFDGGPEPKPGVQFPESEPQLRHGINSMLESGISVTFQ